MENSIFSDKELLQYIKSNNIIDLSSIQQEIEMKKNAEYLSMHPYKIWQCSSDGRWYTRLEGGGKKIKPQSLTRYKNRVKRFLKNNPYAQQIRLLPFEDITEDDLDSLIYDTAENQKMDSKEFHEFLSHMKHMFRYAKRKKYTKESFLDYFEDLDLDTMDFTKIKHSKDELTFTQAEEIALVKKMVELGDIRSLALIILFDTGARIGELSALRKTDIEGDCVHIHATEINYQDSTTGKNAVAIQECTKTDAGFRDIYLSELGLKVINLVNNVNSDSEWLFSEDGRRIKAHSFRKKLYDICNMVEIKRRSPHKVRKAYATKLIYAGVSENIVKELMGHTDIATTRKSYCIDSTTPEEFRTAIKQVSDKKGIGTNILSEGNDSKISEMPCLRASAG